MAAAGVTAAATATHCLTAPGTTRRPALTATPTGSWLRSPRAVPVGRRNESAGVPARQDPAKARGAATCWCTVPLTPACSRRRLASPWLDTGQGGVIVEGSSRVIARILSTYDTEWASLTWEWVLRADGQACCRLAQLRGRRDRNLWRSVTQFSGADLDALIRGIADGEARLAGLALQRGHHVDGYRDRVGGAHE
jgi:hypothetical protein